MAFANYKEEGNSFPLTKTITREYKKSIQNFDNNEYDGINAMSYSSTAESSVMSDSSYKQLDSIKLKFDFKKTP
jgi:hypothetical protein